MRYNSAMEIKTKILEEYLSTLKKRRDNAEKSRKKAQEDANEAESAMQTRYGSAKEENQALEQAFKAKVLIYDNQIAITNKSLNESYSKKTKVTIGALVKLSIPNEKQMNLFCYLFGADNILVNGINVMVVSADTPIYKILYNKTINDSVTLPNGKKASIVEII